MNKITLKIPPTKQAWDWTSSSLGSCLWPQELQGLGQALEASTLPRPPVCNGHQHALRQRSWDHWARQSKQRAEKVPLTFKGESQRQAPKGPGGLVHRHRPHYRKGSSAIRSGSPTEKHSQRGKNFLKGQVLRLVPPTRLHLEASVDETAGEKSTFFPSPGGDSLPPGQGRPAQAPQDLDDQYPEGKQGTALIFLPPPPGEIHLM